ncbi:MAG: YihY/virulence factor BrkB family protein [Anaerolineales bacterium]|jgi:membrane protein
MLKKIGLNLSAAYTWFDRKSKGVGEILVTTIKRFYEEHGPEGAASISYYGIFSLFPLLIFLVAVLGYFLDRFGSPVEIAEFITKAIPVSNDLVYNNLVQILNARGLGGIIGLLGIIWAASSVFTTLSRHINRAWMPHAQTRNVLQHRLFAVIMIFTILALVASWLFSNVFLSLIQNIIFPFFGEIYIFDRSIWKFTSTWIPWLLAFVILLAIYIWFPNTSVKWKEAFWGAALASMLLNISTRIFTSFLSSGIASFEVIYGSLGTGFALVAWVYLSALIVLIGAHLSAAIATVKRINNNQEQPEPSPKEK